MRTPQQRRRRASSRRRGSCVWRPAGQKPHTPRSSSAASRQVLFKLSQAHCVDFNMHAA